jgi:hypothetical protein
LGLVSSIVSSGFHHARVPGWFARTHLIHPIDLSELIQKLWIAIVQTDNFSELGAVTPFVLHDFAPNFDLPKQQ